MANKDTLDKLNKLAVGTSPWLDEARKRRAQRAWLRHSQKIAIRVLGILHKKGMKQKELAEKMGVTPQQINKIVKGKENLTLETIAKLESALGVSLIFHKEKTQPVTQKVFPYKREIKYVYLTVYANKQSIGVKEETYRQGQEFYSEDRVNEEKVKYG